MKTHAKFIFTRKNMHFLMMRTKIMQRLLKSPANQRARMIFGFFRYPLVLYHSLH